MVHVSLATTVVTALLLLSSLPVHTVATPHNWNYSLVWDVDSSSMITTPPHILRGDKGLPVTKYNTANNGNATTIYGNKGEMPHYQGATIVNGGLPQLGNLTVHLTKYRTSINALIPNTQYQGYCLLDYEFWRADWNSTAEVYRTKSVELANGNVALATQQYEKATQRFILATINETRRLRPGCKMGFYGYPRNNLPFVPTPQYKSWCRQVPYRCWFKGYDQQEAGRRQKALNDKLLWLFAALDVITPSIYLGILPQQTTAAANEQYVRSTVMEAARLAKLVGAASQDKRPKVLPFGSFAYNNYWQQATGPREFLTLEDLRIEFELPRAAGADGMLIWGAVDHGRASVNTTAGVHELQVYVDQVFSVVVKELFGG